MSKVLKLKLAREKDGGRRKRSSDLLLSSGRTWAWEEINQTVILPGFLSNFPGSSSTLGPRNIWSSECTGSWCKCLHPAFREDSRSDRFLHEVYIEKLWPRPIFKQLSIFADPHTSVCGSAGAACPTAGQRRCPGRQPAQCLWPLCCENDLKYAHGHGFSFILQQKSYCPCQKKTKSHQTIT